MPSDKRLATNFFRNFQYTKIYLGKEKMIKVNEIKTKLQLISEVENKIFTL